MEKEAILYSKNYNSKKNKQVLFYNCKEYGHFSRNSQYKINGNNNTNSHHSNTRNIVNQNRKNEKREISSTFISSNTSMNVLVNTNERYNTN